jgi:hypothetical protein
MITGSDGEIYSAEFHNLYSSTDINMIKSTTMQRSAHVAYMR